MELEEAKEILKNIIDDEVIGTYCIEIQKEGVPCDINCESQECYLHIAIETVLQELDRLQKENEKLISEKTKLLLTDLAEANRLYDEENKRCMMFAIENNDLKEKLNNSISKDKIREKIEEIKEEYQKRSKDNDSFYFDYGNEYAHIEEVLEDLLKEE